MSDWLAQFTANLEARDTREKAHEEYIQAYTRLADKAAASRHTANLPAPAQPSTSTPPSKIKGRGEATSSPAESTASIRADLASTQKARAALAVTLKDVEAQLAHLQAERRDSTAQIAALSRAKLEAERKLRDRDEELRGKATLVVQAQDEMVSLGLQLNMAEEKAERLTKENKDLVDRWMKRMGEEADKINRDSKWA